MTPSTSIQNSGSWISAFLIFMVQTPTSMPGYDSNCYVPTESFQTTVNTSSSLGVSVDAQEKLKETLRLMRIAELKGRYRNYLTPTDEFARQKTNEIRLEES